MTQWISLKQQIDLYKEEIGTHKKVIKNITKLIESKRKQNTHNSKKGLWTLPDISITISISELNKILNEN